MNSCSLVIPLFGICIDGDSLSANVVLLWATCPSANLSTATTPGLQIREMVPFQRSNSILGIQTLLGHTQEVVSGLTMVFKGSVPR